MHMHVRQARRWSGAASVFSGGHWWLPRLRPDSDCVPRDWWATRCISVQSSPAYRRWIFVRWKVHRIFPRATWTYPTMSRFGVTTRRCLRCRNALSTAGQRCYSRRSYMVARTIGRTNTTERSTVETIHETRRTYECRKFGRKFTTCLQLSYDDRKSEIWQIINTYAMCSHFIVTFTKKL